MVRTTVLKPEDGAEVRAKGLAPLTDSPGDEYRANIQIAELNALNASMAMLAYKQHCGCAQGCIQCRYDNTIYDAPPSRRVE